jgi:uncharacterized repeat protein (TIGR01451 family)
MKWFLGVLLLLAIALVFDLSLLAYAMYALLAVMLASRFLARTWINNLTATREVDRLEANVGDTVTVGVSVKNNGWLPVVWVLLEDVLPKRALLFQPPSLGLVGFRMKLALVAGRKGFVMVYKLACTRRGYYQIGPAVLETGDLFGLHRRYRVGAAPQFLMVFPQITPLEGYDVSSKRPIGEVRMTYRLYEDPTRISGVRPYEQGDPLNRVHWRATARTGLLHSKVYEPSTVAGATVVLDFHQASHDKRHEPLRSELAVTCAASVAHAVYEMGQQVGLVTNGRDAADRVRQEGWAHDARTRKAALESASMLEESDRLAPLVVPTRRGPEQFMRILETLARVELTDGLTLAQLTVETSDRLPRDASVIVILPRANEETAVALGNLRRRGLAVTAILNLHDELDFADSAGLLWAEGIETRHLRDATAISTICRQFVLERV